MGTAKTGVAAPVPGVIEGWIATPDGRRVADARVTIVRGKGVRGKGGLDQMTRSDAKGRFRFRDLEAGTYEIRAARQGFERLKQLVEVKGGETVSLNLTLVLAPVTARITVTATRTEQKLGDVPSQVSLLTADDIKRSPALTIDDFLKQVPGFSLFRRTSSLVSHPTTEGVSLRGIGASGASRTLVSLDGVPLNDHFGNWVYWSKIPQSQIETIEIAPGSISSLYGSSAMAGVIHIQTRRPEPRTMVITGKGGMRGTGHLDFFGSHKVGPFGLGVGGSLFRTGGYKLVREEERGPVDINATSRHETLNWQFDYSPTSKTRWFHNGRFFDEDRGNGTLLQVNSTRETYLGGGLWARTSEGGELQTNVFSHFQTFKSSFSRVGPDRATETLALVQDVPSNNIGVNTLWTRRFAGSHQLALGADLRRAKANNLEEVFLSSGLNIRDRFIVGKQLYTGFFIQDLVKPSPRLVLVFSARVDYWRNFGASSEQILNTTQETTLTRFPDTSTTTVSPRAAMLFRLTDRFSLRGAFYQGFRAPTLNELYRPFRVGNVQTNANANLGAERLTGVEAGFNHSLGRRFFWRATGFWNRVKDPISNVTLSATPALILRQRQNLGRLRVQGIDAEIEYRINTQWGVRTRYLLNEATVSDFSANREIEGKFIPQVPKHRASLGLDYFNQKWFNVSVHGRFESSRFDDDLNRFKLGSFFVAGLAASKPLRDPWEVFVAVENLFNRRYAVRATPVALLGTPIIVSAGVRFHLSPF